MSRRIKRLPPNYKIEPIDDPRAIPSGYHLVPALHHWEIRTTGHLWWKRTTPGWYLVKAFDKFTPREDIIDYAHRIEETK